MLEVKIYTYDNVDSILLKTVGSNSYEIALSLAKQWIKKLQEDKVDSYNYRATVVKNGKILATVENNLTIR